MMLLRYQPVLGFVYLATALAAAPMMAQAPAAPAAAPAAAAQTPAAANATRVHGTITDPDGELIPGATVTFTPAKGTPKKVQSGSDGTYSVGLPAGTYTIVVSMTGFSTYTVQNQKIGANPSLTFDAKLKIGEQSEVINVDSNASVLSVDPDNNASATIITGDALAALSDDPDDLASELSAMAGPAAGPNGGTIYIDGFTGGQLPPKSSIREIRINQNPFSAQYDRPGFGRVEVFTKPGTDQFHGSASVQGNDKVFNTGSPLIPGYVPQPNYYQVLGYGQVSGPLTKKSSFTFGFQYRNIHDNSVIDPENLLSLTSNPGMECPPGTLTGCTLYPFLGYVASVPSPNTRFDISPRVDLGLGAKNTMTLRYRYERQSINNTGIGSNQLTDNAYNSFQSEQEIQMGDTENFTDKLINEIHFEWQREIQNQTPLNTTPQLSVSGSFIGGGDPTGIEANTQNHFEFQNYTSIALKKNFIRMGGRLRLTHVTNTTNEEANGLFSYTSAQFSTVPNCTAGQTPTVAVPCYTQTGGTYSPSLQIQNYEYGLASNYTFIKYNQPTVSLTNADLGLYAETDWKVRPNLTISYGARFETQNFINDKADIAPRVSLAWGVGKKKSGGPMFVVRSGYGLFYDRFSLGNQENVVQENGLNQIPLTLASTYTGTAITPISTTCTPTSLSTCNSLASSTGHLTTQTVQPSYHSPYQEQTNIGTDISPFKNATVSFNYQHVRGVHQLINDNLNAPAGVTNSAAPIQDQYLTEGYYRQNQFITNFSYRGSAKWSLSSYYVLNFDTKSDTSGAGSFPTIWNNIGADYGRASFATRSQIFLFGSFNLPYLISISPLMSARSGTPINITTGEDNFGYLTYNTRPVFAPAGTPGAKTFGGCGTFVDPGKSPNAPYAQIPVNYCTGPAVFTTNLRISKTIGFGKRAGSDNNTRSGGGPDGGSHGSHGGGPGGFPGGMMGGGGSRGGGGYSGGGGGGGGTRSGQKYNLSLGVQIQNVFNVVDRSNPNGVLSSASFGQLTGLAGQLYTGSDNVRRVQLTASFNF